ncbi:hypothetical protein Dimus_008897, partial [Dionaea muscipula]
VVLEGGDGRRTASACGGLVDDECRRWRGQLDRRLLLGGGEERSARVACSSSRRWVVMAVLSSFLGVGVADEQAMVGGVAGGGEAGGDMKTADGDGVSLVVMGVGFLVTMDAARALLGDVVMEYDGFCGVDLGWASKRMRISVMASSATGSRRWWIRQGGGRRCPGDGDDEWRGSHWGWILEHGIECVWFLLRARDLCRVGDCEMGTSVRVYASLMAGKDLLWSFDFVSRCLVDDFAGLASRR